jgi:lipoate-protein ligase A
MNECLGVSLSENPRLARNLPTKNWQWIDFSCQSGTKNMEDDQRLFDQLKKGTGFPSLRFFKWQSPAVSYGRTQGLDPATKKIAELKNLEIARRPSGGGKVFHGEDLCFSLVWNKKNAQIPWKVRDSYRAIHQWIGQSLAELGFQTEMVEGKAHLQTGWCFEGAVCFDLVSSGQKIVGGAQWRDGDAALHQGSIQLTLERETLPTFKRHFETLFKIRFAFPSTKQEKISDLSG